MRVLTVKQPWADLIMAGVKDVENRSWPVPSTLPQWSYRERAAGAVRRHPRTSDCDLRDCEPDGPFPFTLGIHAAQQVDKDAPNQAHDLRAKWCLSRRGDARHEDTLGVLLGTVQVTGCHHADECESRSCEHGPEKWCFVPCGPTRWCSRWAEPDCWHWTLADPVPLDVPVPMKGRQGLWTLTAVEA